jgi:hypothetical protein
LSSGLLHSSLELPGTSPTPASRTVYGIPGEYLTKTAKQTRIQRERGARASHGKRLMMSRKGRGLLAAIALAATAVAVAGAQSGTPSPQTQALEPPPPDSLGRSNPRGSVLAFLNAARRGENELARQYLDTRLSGEAAEDLAHQLFVVLDARLPARLTLISDSPDGSRADRQRRR